ncbi:hypothetical protein RND81_07G140900 [Saponaria officinalis]|uniref:F-box domain-containing protein n=1 Tax=Saponaria officinalis TaxID=3572 RepID=A0AAW1JN88_SAPOF
MVDDVEFSEVGTKRKGVTMVDDVEFSEVPTKRKKPNTLDELFDELLVEILCRLPCCKNAVMCMSVCKYWATMISHPSFVRRFVSHKISEKITPPANINGVSKYDELRIQMTKDRMFGLVVRNRYDVTWKGYVIRFNDPMNNPCNVSFSCLPRLVNRGGLPRRLTLAATCNDLLLYQRHVDDFRHETLELYISNVQTKQWLALPSLNVGRQTKQIGLICDPYCSSDVDAFRACIVVIPYTLEDLTEFPAHLLSHNTRGVWRNVVLSLPSIRCQIDPNGPHFCIGTKIYFHFASELIGYIISFDAFVDVTSSGVIKCHSLLIPQPAMVTSSFFGVFHGQLHMCEYDDDGRYRVWALKDHETGEWSLRHSVIGRDWILRDRSLAKLVNNSPVFGNTIGFHPVNPDIIYVLSQRWIILCNLSTRTMEIACKLPRHTTRLFPFARSFDITLPLWPTPLPTLV